MPAPNVQQINPTEYLVATSYYHDVRLNARALLTKQAWSLGELAAALGLPDTPTCVGIRAARLRFYDFSAAPGGEGTIAWLRDGNAVPNDLLTSIEPLTTSEWVGMEFGDLNPVGGIAWVRSALFWSLQHYTAVPAASLSVLLVARVVVDVNDPGRPAGVWTPDAHDP